MNTYQKIGVLVIRIFSTIIFGVGSMGLLYPMFGMYDPLKFRAAVVWVIFGAVVFALARPLGKLIGSGLR